MKYYRPKQGEWVQHVNKGYKLACCDCGLVHNVDFRIYHNHVQFRVFRNNRSTAVLRTHKRRKEIDENV